MFTLEQIKENRRKWVDALRSGKYRQGSNYLRRDGDKYCCLGVLTQLAGCMWRGPEAEATVFTSGSENQFAPVKAMQFVGLRENDGDYNETSLASLNDDGVSFAEIAELIEREPEGLFLPDDEIKVRGD